MYIYAGLWNINSSDIERHDVFCRGAKNLRIFDFRTTGKYAEKGKPYTYDDGGSSLD